MTDLVVGRKIDNNPVGFGQQTLTVCWDLRREDDKTTLLGDHYFFWGGYMFIVKTGYRFDGASIPRAFWRIVGHPWGRYAPAALLHDILYDTEHFPRDKADQALRDLMKVLPVPSWKRQVIYRAVRAGGGFTWKKHDAHSIEKASQYLRVVKL